VAPSHRNSHEKGYEIKIDLIDNYYKITKDYKLEDDGSMFFFHVFPEDLDNLPKNRKKYKFSNSDVKGEKQVTFKDKDTFYFGKKQLPDYKIKSIHFGHFQPKGEKYYEKRIMVNE